MEESSRRDPTEGTGHTKEPGIVTVGWVSPNPSEKTIWTREPGYQECHGELGNPVFLFSTCLPNVDLDHMREAFGKHIVRINNPRQLAVDVYDYFMAQGERVLIVGCEVVYNKGQKLDRPLTDNERVDMSYKQKPESFAPDCEFRIVVIRFGDPCAQTCKFLNGQFRQVEPECKSIQVNLGKPLRYADLVDLA
jgi:hypothetical protein